MIKPEQWWFLSKEIPETGDSGAAQVLNVCGNTVEIRFEQTGHVIITDGKMMETANNGWRLLQ